MFNFQDIDYTVKGYHKKETFDINGDLIKVEYFENYDSQTETFDNLVVVENRIYYRDSNTGLLTKREMTINWIFNNDPENIVTSKNTIKYYTPEKGHFGNIKARQNLTLKASMYLFSTIGKIDSIDFWNDVRNEVNNYERVSEIQPLIDAINNSSKTYLTSEIKSNLVTILNITFV